jgi:hypothetical protein
MNNGQARSSVVEHCFDVAGVSGSIPLAPTKKQGKIKIGNSDFNNNMWIRFV